MWDTIYNGREIHVIPSDDLIEHEQKNCICKPKIEEGVVASDQTIKWVYVHTSLDGRELLE